MSEPIRAYHNPNCASSKHAVGLAEQLGVKAEVIVHQKTSPDRATLLWIAQHLEDPISDLVRNDSLFAEAIRAILSAKPASLAVDMLFVDVTAQDASLRDALERGAAQQNHRPLLG